jgi:subtilase family serine protease
MLQLKQLVIGIFPLLMLGSSGYAGEIQRMPLVTPGLALVPQAEFVKRVSADKTRHFIVWLNLRNKDKLDKLVRDIYDPTSAKYHHYLTGEQFKSDYAPSEESFNRVQHYFSAQGMSAKRVHNSIRVTAKVKQIEQVFKIKMNTYRFQGKTVIANASSPTLNPDIAQDILEVSGLNEMIQFKPNNHRMPKEVTNVNAKGAHDLNFSWNSFVPLAQPTTTSIGGLTGSQLQTAYNLANVQPINGIPIDGAGQTVVIINACGINNASTIQADANSYNAANGITPLSAANFSVINPDGTPYTSCGTAGLTGWETEIALDVESAHTIAPGANTVLILSSANTNLDSAVGDVIMTLTQRNFTIGGFGNAYVISNSWGATEVPGGIPSLETNLQIAAASGLSFNFSSGDCGDNTYTSSGWGCAAQSLSVLLPASSPFVTAIGGTSLFVDNSYTYAFESGWGTYLNSAFVSGSGGGLSTNNSSPSWQSAISGFTAGGYNGGDVGSYNMRAIPDIAMLADSTTGLFIYVSNAGSSPFPIGGTSLACPLFTGTLALINQARTLLSGGAPQPIGQAAPLLYIHNNTLSNSQAINPVVPPHQIISGATPPPIGAPLSAFTIGGITYSWDSSLTIIENQFWNDVVGVGTPNVPNFVMQMALL